MIFWGFFELNFKIQLKTQGNNELQGYLTSNKRPIPTKGEREDSIGLEEVEEMELDLGRDC